MRHPTYLEPDTPIRRSDRKATMIGKWIAVSTAILTLLGAVYFIIARGVELNRSPERLNKLETEQVEQNSRTTAVEQNYARIDERLKAIQKQQDGIEAKIDKIKPSSP